MATRCRAHRIIVEVGGELLAALNDEVAKRSTNVRQVTRSEVLRQMIAERFGIADASKVGAAS